MYIEFEDRSPALESFELCDGIVVDLDADEHVVGIEVEWASQKLDIERLRAVLEPEPAARPPERQGQHMPDTVEVRVNDVGDILYLRFQKAKIAACREVDDLRCADYDSEGRLIGVELIGLPGGVSLLGLPEAERIREALLEHGPPELRIEGDEVFHPIQAKPAPAQ